MIFDLVSKGAVRIVKLVTMHSTEVLGGVAIMSIGGGIFSAIKAAPKFEKIRETKNEEIEELDQDEECSNDEYKIKKAAIYKRYLKDAAVTWIPTITFTAISVISVVAIVKISAKKQAALAAALSLADDRLHQYEKYEEKVKNALGPKKDQKIKDEVLREQIQDNPPANVIETGNGSVLCLDSCSGRYFRSSPEFIRKVEGTLNKRLTNEMWVSLNDLYFELGLPSIGVGDEIGWNLNKDGWIDMNPKSTLTQDDIPVYVLDFHIMPRSNYKASFA